MSLRLPRCGSDRDASSYERKAVFRPRLGGRPTGHRPTPAIHRCNCWGGRRDHQDRREERTPCSIGMAGGVHVCQRHAKDSSDSLCESNFCRHQLTKTFAEHVSSLAERPEIGVAWLFARNELKKSRFSVLGYLSRPQYRRCHIGRILHPLCPTAEGTCYVRVLPTHIPGPVLLVR